MDKVYTAIITPFLENQEIDVEAFTNLVVIQEKAGIDGIVIAGTTGEGWSLSLLETGLLYKIAKKHFNKDIIVSTGCISTKGAIKKTQLAKKLGADACLVIVPFYNLPCQEGVKEHFEAIAKLGLDIIIYHHPKRTGVTLSVEALKDVCSIKGVVGLKETHYQKEELLRLSQHVYVYSGNDTQMVEMKSYGAKGVISVISNLYPKETKEYFATNIEKAQVNFSKRMEKISEKDNPVGIKAAMAEKNLCKNVVRGPLKSLCGLKLNRFINNLQQTKDKEIANI